MKVLLADDHALVRNGIASLLAASGVEVVGEAADGLEALAKARELRPDIVLMDIEMPGCDGMEATRLVKGEVPGVKVVMLTVSEDDRDLLEAIRSGADGYLTKNLQAGEFLSYLSGVMRGEAAVSPRMATRIIEEFARYSKKAGSPVAGETLTGRESDVLNLVVAGNTNRQIATGLSISENTVKYHLKNIMKKLGLANRAQVVAHAISKGLLPKRSPGT